MAGLIDIGIDQRNQANAAFAQVAQQETDRANFNRQMNAQRKAGEWNAAGQGVGLGAVAYSTGALGNVADKLGASYTLQNALKPDSQVSPTDAETADTEQLASEYEANPPDVSATRASINDLNVKPSPTTAPKPTPKPENGTQNAPEEHEEEEASDEPTLTEPTSPTSPTNGPGLSDATQAGDAANGADAGEGLDAATGGDSLEGAADLGAADAVGGAEAAGGAAEGAAAGAEGGDSLLSLLACLF